MVGGAVRQLAVVAAYVGTIVMNTLANTLPLAGRDTGEISAMFPIPFTPAGWVFSIWGVIYLGLAAFAVYQALPSQRTDRRLDAIGWWFVASCVFNVSWLVAWHTLTIPLTLLLMLGLLGTLIAIYERSRAGHGSSTGSDAGVPARSTGWRWVVEAPFSLYLGWITVATVANGAIFLYDLGWQPGVDAAAAWSALLVVAAAGIGLTVVTRRRDAIYGFVLVWAFAGIAAKEWSAPLLATTAIVAAAIVGLWAVRTVLADRKRGGTPA